VANVKVYSTNTCPWCVRVKEFLKEHNVEFDDLNVQEDQNAFKEMVEKTGQRGVPVVDIDGKIIIGFNEEAIRKLLDLKE